ncbi:MAG: DUF4194 domain-containing protein [Ferrovibrio sp.]|uniref:DUF4194 domain-containing protein n=1 Tax=Ferrovibrio sp. TaxID=1917215 RepID=UPI0039199FB5
MSDAERIADRLDSSGQINDARSAMQTLLTRQFLYESDMRTQRSYRFIRENWREIEPLIDVMGFKPYRDFEAGVIGILLQPIFDREGTKMPPPMERRISLQESRLLVVLRQLYHMGMTGGHPGCQTSDRPGVIMTSTDDIMAAMAEYGLDRQYRNVSALLEDLKLFERNGIIDVEGVVGEGNRIVSLLPALPIIFENDGFLEMLAAYARAALAKKGNIVPDNEEID